MKFLSRLFSSHKTEPTVRPKPEWAETVRLMRDRSLNSFADNVVMVAFSGDGEHRFVLLESEKGFFRYLLEDLTPLDDEEWRFVSADPSVLPAVWIPRDGNGTSFFGTREEALKDFRTAPDYPLFFPDLSE